EFAFALDVHGFAFARAPSAETAFDDDARVRTVYYPETAELLRKATGAKRVVVFDHTVLRCTPRRERRHCQTNAGGLLAQTSRTSSLLPRPLERVHQLLGADAPRLLWGWTRLINVWRPIAHAVAHRPLAVGDWRTLDESAGQLVPVKYVYPGQEGATFSVKYSARPQFWYLGGMRREEVVLIKCYDSEEGGVARLSPHSAFVDGGSPKDAPTRQLSIELRALCSTRSSRGDQLVGH
ncbi:uncharacterized protein BXZ73DRAFT_46468, partial [Epithele typhae]|uniref:uncharacterized protein n=1 Tax=Epithele typhae TaxID=378194 RepID=UPI002008509E